MGIPFLGGKEAHLTEVVTRWQAQQLIGEPGNRLTPVTGH
jgi:hypothetical protein